MSSFAIYAPRSSEQPGEPLPQSLAIVPATLDDVPGIAGLVSEREGITLDEALARTSRGLQIDAERGDLVLCAKVEGNVIGFGRARSLKCLDAEVPQGWYLMGIIIADPYRRRGIATELTRLRLAWIAEHAGEAYYFANSLNLASIDLHRRLGFVEARRPFRFPGVTFSRGGIGVLFRINLKCE